MRILLTGGGTGGHVNPALAIAEIIKQNDPTAVIEFVGVRGKKEEDLVPREGYKLHFVQSRGFTGKLPTPSNLKAAYLAFTSPRAKDTQAILDEFSPDIVIGTGGYASWPIMRAATLRGIPTALHESNAHPGKTVRRLARCVDRVWTNFPETESHFKRKDNVLRVGNPLRAGFGSITREAARKRLGLSDDRLLILSYGGSGGARNINRGVVSMMRDFSAKDKSLLHIHAAGKSDLADTVEAYRRAGLEACDNCIVYEYIYEMPLYMAAADLVISRAGAMTVSELAKMKKACILIPFPQAAYDHQASNARALSDVGAAKLLSDADAGEGGRLSEVAREILYDEAKRASMQEKISAFSDPATERRIWEDILTLTGKKSKK